LKILVTNGAYKNALCAIRSLGNKGYTVGVVAHHRMAIGFFSKHCHKKHIISTLDNKAVFIENLIKILKKDSYDVLLPIGYPQTAWISEYADKLKPYVRIPIAPWDKIQIFQDKEKTQTLAKSLDIPTPKTFYLNPLMQDQYSIEIDSISEKINYPVVLKYKNEGENHAIIYAKNKEALKHEYLKLATERPHDLPMIQEYLDGEGVGFFALYDNGVCKQYFMHERIREYPVSGGSSCCAQSIDNEQLKYYGLKILDALKWHGVAMVEFKYDKKVKNMACSDIPNPFGTEGGVFADRIPHLLEVNPKFWGSLDLSEAAGVGFVEKTVKLAMNQSFQINESYIKNIQFSWLFDGDLLHGVETGQALKIIRNWLKGSFKTNLILSDPLPSFILIFKNMPIILKTLFKNLS
jgi:predicted ATP-grasp superfamily ATP-dependent carboligase